MEKLLFKKNYYLRTINNYNYKMSYNEVTDLYCQIGNYLEDCKEYYENIDKYIKEETGYISDLFEQIEESKKNNDVKELVKLLIEVRAYVISLRSNPKLWKYTD